MTASFEQFEQYAESVEDADLRMMLPRLAKPSWKIHSFSVGDLHVQIGREGSGNITEGSSVAGGQVIFLPLRGFHCGNGVPIHRDSLFLLRPGREFTISVHEAHDWCSVFVPQKVINENASRSPVMRQEGNGCSVLEVDTKSIGGLRYVLNCIEQAVDLDPQVLTAPNSLRSMQRRLSAACRGAVIGRSPVVEPMGRPRIPRDEVMSLVRPVIEQHIDDGLTLEELINATDVSERTLRTVFLEYFGVPPKQYLMKTRLHRVRNALRKANPETTTVTAIAAEFGFWHFGRFAAVYRKLFGESPSTTLRGCVPKSGLSLVLT